MVELAVTATILATVSVAILLAIGTMRRYATTTERAQAIDLVVLDEVENTAADGRAVELLPGSKIKKIIFQGNVEATITTTVEAEPDVFKIYKITSTATWKEPDADDAERTSTAGTFIKSPG